MRIGHGFDVHRFGEGDSVTLGGVQIPHIHGLIAHSDGNVLLHALCDALLGACALGDIGKHFPDDDDRWRNADSRELLRAVVKLVRQAGRCVINADMTVIAEAPKLAPFIEQMRIAIAADLGCSPDAVGVKATTSEGLGFTGRGEGIAAHAVVLLGEGTLL